MRSPGFLCAALVVVCLFPMRGGAQDNGGAEPPLEPYHKHHDTRHGHDHFYPDRGAIVRNLPAGAATVNYAGLSFRFQDGVWFEPRGPAFMVVSPPIGLVVPALPGFVTVLAHGGGTYLYANDTYYRPRPDVGGYEVVNDPAETPASAIPTSTAAVGNAATDDDDGPPPVVTPLPDATASAVAPAVNAVAAKSAVIPAAATSANSVAPTPAPPTSAAPAAATGTTAAAPAAAAAGGVTLAAASTANGAAPPAAAPPPAPAPAPAPASDAPAPAVAKPPAPAAAVPAAASTTSGPPRGAKIALTPRNGQSADQEARDRYDCYRFAVTQTGFDPLRWNPAGNGAQEYSRAQVACLEARGYSVQ
jgi:hypothetical protein